MATTPTGENPTTSSDRECEDWTKVWGIKGKRQQKLRELFDICTLHDLAAISGKKDKIKSVAKGLGVSPSLIKRAVACAQELIADADTPSQQIVEPTESESEGRADSPTSEGEWEWIAAFIVEFKVLKVEGQEMERQITVGRMGVNKGGTWLPGSEDKKPTIIEGEQLYPWMQEQLGERMPQVPEPEEKPPVEVWPAAAPPVRLEITQIRAFQPPQTETPTGIGKAGGPFQGFIRSGEPFALEVSFALTGSAVADIVKRQTTYSAQFQVRNLITRAKKPLGDTKPAVLVAGKPRKAMLPQSSLQPGLYRLQVLTTLQSTPPIVGYLEVPLLQVV